MIYTAISIHDGRITARHESTVPISTEMITNTSYAGQELRAVESSTEYAIGCALTEYTADGKLRPLIDRIKEGLTPCPPGWELVGDELVEVTATPEEAPPSIGQKLSDLEREKNAMLAQIDAVQRKILGL